MSVPVSQKCVMASSAHSSDSEADVCWVCLADGKVRRCSYEQEHALSSVKQQDATGGEGDGTVHDAHPFLAAGLSP